jgi:YtkA-like
MKNALAMLVSLLFFAACAPQNKNQLAVRLEQPTQSVGKRELILNVTKDGQPLEVAELSVEGNMTHAGMGTVTDTAKPLGNGRYAVRAFDFNMSGDWVLTVTAVKDAKTLTGEVQLGVRQ